MATLKNKTRRNKPFLTSPSLLNKKPESDLSNNALFLANWLFGDPTSATTFNRWYNGNLMCLSLTISKTIP